MECPTSECPQAAQTLSPAHVQMWRDAAAIHQIKIAFVDALQRFVRAQAGTFGDEGDELRASLAAMRDSLTKWDLAIRTFQAKTSGLTHNVESSIALATILLDRHRIDDALRALVAAEQIDDSRADLYAMRALAYGALNRPEEAARALRRAAGLNGRDPTLVYALARHLTQLGRLDEAAQPRRSLPRLLAASRQTAFARVGLLSQAAGTAPIFAHARYMAGFSALDSGDYETALETLAEAVEQDPLVRSAPDARAGVVRAAAALRNGQLDSTLQQLQTLVAAHPDDAETHRLLGLAYWVNEENGKSIEHLRSAIRLAPNEERARVLLFDVLSSDRRLTEAERELMLASDAGIRSGQVSYRLAQLYQRQSLLPQAAKAFQDSEAFGPVVGRDTFYLTWGSLLVNQADFAGAVAAYSKRIDVNTNSADAHRQLGEIYFLQGRDEEALSEFLVTVWLDPKNAKAHAATGQVYIRRSQWSEAAAALQRALALDGSLREARYALGTALMRAGRREEARTELEVFAQQQAEAEAAGQREFQLDAIRRQASKDALAGDRQGALARFEDAARIDPQSARSHRDLGLALLRAQRPREAVEYLVAAQRIEETAEGFVYLVDAYGAVGNAEEANRQRALARAFALSKKMERVRELGKR